MRNITFVEDEMIAKITNNRGGIIISAIDDFECNRDHVVNDWSGPSVLTDGGYAIFPCRVVFLNETPYRITGKCEVFTDSGELLHTIEAMTKEETQ